MSISACKREMLESPLMATSIPTSDPLGDGRPILNAVLSRIGAVPKEQRQGSVHQKMAAEFGKDGVRTLTCTGLFVHQTPNLILTHFGGILYLIHINGPNVLL